MTATTTANLTTSERDALERDLREERDNLQALQYDAAGRRFNGLSSALLDERIMLANEVIAELEARLAATGSDGPDGDAGAELLPVGTVVEVEYMGAPGFIPRGKRQGTVVGHRGSRMQYVVVDVVGCNVPKSYLASAVVVVDAQTVDAA